MRILVALAILPLLGAPCSAAPPACPGTGSATLDDARSVTDQLHLSAMMARVLDQQKAMVDRTIRRMMPRAHPGDPAAVERAVREQEKTMDLLWASIDLKAVQDQMTEVYREVFTADELHGMAEFYGTPAGRAAIEKQPRVQERMMQIMMPRIMAALQQSRQRAKPE